MTLKAYVVSDDEYQVIEFSEHRATAQRNGANELNTEFQFVTCHRAPQFDSYAEARRVPWRDLIEIYGWTQECSSCCRRVGADDEARVYGDNENVFCNSECKQKHDAMWERIKQEQQP